MLKHTHRRAVVFTESCPRCQEIRREKAAGTFAPVRVTARRSANPDGMEVLMAEIDALQAQVKSLLMEVEALRVWKIDMVNRFNVHTTHHDSAQTSMRGAVR